MSKTKTAYTVSKLPPNVWHETFTDKRKAEQRARQVSRPDTFEAEGFARIRWYDCGGWQEECYVNGRRAQADLDACVLP